MGMLLLERRNRLASIRVGQLGEPGQSTPQRFLVFFVEIRPAFTVERKLVGRTTPGEQLGYSGKGIRRFNKPSPCIGPAARSRTESRAGRHVRFGLGVELEGVLALGAEGVPTAALHPGSCPLGVGHPAEDVAHDVHASQLAEVARVQAAAPQLPDLGQSHLVQRSVQRRDGVMVGCDVEVRPGGGAEKSRHGPIPALRVVP